MSGKRLRNLIAAGLLAIGAVFVTASPVWAQEEGGDEPHISHAAEECIKLLEEGNKEPDDCQKAPSPIKPATNELVWGGLSFLIVLGGLYFLGYPAVKSAMEARTQKIRDSLDEAERTRSDAERVLEEYQHQLADAKNESSRIIEEARQTAEQMRRDLMARAEAEVNELKARTTADVRAERDRLLSELQSQVAELAIGAAEVVVQKNLDAETNRALVERFIEQVGTR